MTSWITLLSKIETFCNAHLQIQKYGGEFREQMPNFSTKDEKYPIIYVEPVSDTEDLNTNQFTINIYCVDIIQKDRANINTIVSDCQLILKDIYVYYVNDNDPTLDVIGTATMTTLNNLDLDYVAGWVMSITFEVNSYGDCAIPMEPIPPPSPTECEKAELVILDTDGNQLYNLFLASGSITNQTIQDVTWKLENTVPTTLLTGSILAEGSATIIAPDAQLKIKHSQGGTIANLLVPSGALDEYTVADSDIEVNGNYEFSIHATHTYDIQLKDQSNNTITPTSITSNPNHADIVINMAAPVGATLMKTGQTVSTNANDDADIEMGRLTNFTTLASNNPFGNNNRFTSKVGTQVYTDSVVIDWSTYNGSTVLAYYYGDATTRAWTTQLGQHLTSTFDSLTGWYLFNIYQAMNIMNFDFPSSYLYNYAPFNLTRRYMWVSTNQIGSNGIATETGGPNPFTISNKANSLWGIWVRQCSVNGTIIT